MYGEILSVFVIYVARSPLYSHISATVQGLTTIRAYKEQNRFVNKLHFYQNEHSKGWHVKIAISRWFGLRVDTIGGLFIVVVMFASIPLADSEYSISYICIYYT